LVEFARFDDYAFEAVPAKGGTPWKPARYLGFVLPAGEPDNVQMIDLGEAEAIERMIAGFRASITGGERSLRPSEPLPAMRTNDGADLRRAVFDPLVPALRGRTRLFLAPDGDLTRLPFEALPVGDGRCLIDDFQLSYLGVGRDLLRFGAEIPGQSARPLVIADPDFDLGMAGTPTPAGESRPPGRQSRALDPSALHFDPLPGTHVEGEHIAARLGVQPWLQADALEGQIRASPSPRILHIATHGFFLEDQKPDPSRAPLEPERPGPIMGSSPGRLSHALENPLLRSGLALAGANTWLQDEPLPAEAEDGILTAEDVSGLDLLGTDLVVLSACETGLGEVQVGEGVFGLRRAFVLAGAKTLVMSLWKVPDQHTQELMEDFYRRILMGEPRADALRSAQLAMKARHPEPLYWGAFICQGEPDPLQGKEPGHA
jgi:CHAT domain-containing protein